MTTDRTFDPRTITQYLLGALPEAETERLDELSITDDEFAEALRVAEKDLVDAYVQGELSADQLQAFKTFYLASPMRREKVEFARAFQGWSAKNATATAAQVRTEGRPVRAAGWFSGLTAFKSVRFGWQWGFAVVVLLLLVTGGLLLFQNMRLRQQMTQERAKQDLLLRREEDLKKEAEALRSTKSKTEPELARARDERERLEQDRKQAQADAKPSPADGSGGVVSVILAAPLRGAGHIPVIAVKPGTNRVAAQLQLEAADYSAYRVALIDPSGNQTLWRSGKLEAKATRDGKALYVIFNAGLLRSPTVYLLRVAVAAANGAEEVISDYSFKVEK